MEMTDLRILPPPPYLAREIRHAVGLVAAMLEHDSGGPPPPDAGSGHAEAAATFLGQLMFAVQLASGADPRAARDLLRDAGRGPDLARRFLAEGTVEVCCDYCGDLLVLNLAAAAAAQMTALHGTGALDAWQLLTSVIMPREPDPGPGPALGPRPYLP